MLKNRPSFYPVGEVFSRQQIHAITGIPDDVLAFWIKQELLLPLPAEPRMHRRFNYEQLHIAVVLNAMRSLGANVAVLRKFALGLQRGMALRRVSGLDDRQLYYAAKLTRSLRQFQRCQPVRVASETWEQDGELWRLAKSEEDLIERWLADNGREADLPPAIPFTHDLTAQEADWIEWALALLDPDLLSSREEANFLWIAWIDGNGAANLLWGEESSFPDHRGRFTAAFYLSLSGLIRPLWPDAVRKATRAKEIDRHNSTILELRRLEESDPAQAKIMRRRHGLPDNWAETYHLLEDDADMTG